MRGADATWGLERPRVVNKDWDTHWVNFHVGEAAVSSATMFTGLGPICLTVLKVLALDAHVSQTSVKPNEQSDFRMTLY